MNCLRVKSLLSEFADEKLDAGTAWQVQTHLSRCESCEQIHRQLGSVRLLLRALPAAAPSAGFDAALAQRLALTRRPAAAPQTWRTRLGSFLSPPRATPARLLRPAFALSLVLGAGAFAALFPGHPTAVVPPPVVQAAHAADPAFVADCVAQHHRDAAAEPLADLSAQTLAGSLDSAPTAEAPADTDTAADSSVL